jgi:hypothetical protein
LVFAEKIEMLNKEPGPERAKLGFKETVLSSFEFLGDFDLHPVQEEVTFVRYESSEVFVNVFHGRASFELGVEIGRLKQPTEKLTLYDIVAWAGAEKAEGFGQHVRFQVSSRNGVQEFVPKLASLINKHAAPLLRGDGAAYDSALESQSEREKEYAKEENLKSVRSKAEAARQAKDYAQVVELYDSMRKDLTKVEGKRLAYAEQQILAAEGVSPRSSNRRKR